MMLKHVIIFLKSFFIGSIVSLPVGPVGILCLRRMILQGPKIGIISGLGAATADFIFTAIACFGLTIIAPFLSAHMLTIKIMGAVILAVLGLKIFLSKPHESDSPVWVPNLAQSYFSAFGLTIANPLTIISLGSFIAGLSIDLLTASYYDIAYICVGIFLGACTWWFFLGMLTQSLHLKIKPGMITFINHAAALVIIISAITILFTIFF